ncbi:energy transducer TonB [Methylobacter sp. G7]|uniref:energy transducer TonB n=1 Tax=Methylobacter sp. G7 TaxID=3230117 RepID=UPI003D802695
MYLFKSPKGGLTVRGLTPFVGANLFASTAATRINSRPLFTFLTRQEKPYSIGGLLLILVLSLHLWAAIWMLQPAEAFTKAQPMIMEVSLISAPSQQAAAAPIAQPKPVEPKKQPVKKPVKKKKLVTRKQMELPKPQPMAEDMLPAPSTAESAPAPVATSAAANTSSKATAETAPFTEANFNANYGSNPKPKYPGIATSRGWEGTVHLRVRVSVEGDSEDVTVQRSSGHDVLDEAAIEAVEKWKFMPAKRGGTAVASSVIVPIEFVLNN